MMLNWKSWCRLCANFEVSEKIEPEIQKIAEQLFEIPSNHAFICLDCKAYVQDLNNFVIKARNVSELFDELEQAEQQGEANDEVMLQLRLNYNLSIPEIHFIEEPDADLVEDFTEIECFKLDEGEIINEAEEYLIETEDTDLEPEVIESEELLEEVKAPLEVISEMKEEIDEEIVHFEDDDLIFQEVAMETDSDFRIVRNEEYDNDIANHFEFRCHVCDEIFKKMYFLTTHTRSMHNCFPRVLCKCGKSIGSTKTLIEHYENHIAYCANFRCNDCNKNYKTQAHYNNHMLTHHQEEESDSRKFICECGKAFKEMRHLTVHRNSHLPDELKFIHPCNYCDRRYSSVFSLRQHIKHIHVKEMNIKCPHCDKTFSRKANLDSHVSHVHTEVRKFICDLCGLAVKTKSILRVHKKIHSTNPEDSLPCGYCNKTFKTQNQLTNHMVCHSNIKKYKCTFCIAEYKRSKDLACHIASAHTGEAKYTCKFCPKTFYSNSNFRKHCLRVHQKKMIAGETLETLETE